MDTGDPSRVQASAQETNSLMGALKGRIRACVTEIWIYSSFSLLRIEKSPQNKLAGRFSGSLSRGKEESKEKDL